MEKKSQRSWVVHLLSVIIILGVFAISCLILTNIGVKVYQKVVLNNNRNFELRTSLSYLATKIRQTDVTGYPYMEQKDGVDVLVLGEEIEGTMYQTLVYHMDGALYELFKEETADYELDYGEKTMDVAGFSFDLSSDRFITLTAVNSTGEEESLGISLRTRR